MTKAQREKHKKDIENLIISYGYELDRWGTFRKGIYKINLRKNNIKVFMKDAQGFKKISSVPLLRIDSTTFEQKLKIYDMVREKVYMELESRFKRGG